MAILKGQDGSQGNSVAPGAIGSDVPEKIFSSKSASQKFKIFNNAGDQFVAQRPFNHGLNDCRFSKLAESYVKDSIKIKNNQGNSSTYVDLKTDNPTSKVYKSYIVKDRVNSAVVKTNNQADLLNGIEYIEASVAIRETPFGNLYKRDINSSDHLDGNRQIDSSTNKFSNSDFTMDTFQYLTPVDFNSVAPTSTFAKTSGEEQFNRTPAALGGGYIGPPGSSLAYGNVDPQTGIYKTWVFNSMVDTGTVYQQDIGRRLPINGTAINYGADYTGEGSDGESHKRWLFENSNQLLTGDQKDYFFESADGYYLTDTTTTRDTSHIVSDHASNIRSASDSGALESLSVSQANAVYEDNLDVASVLLKELHSPGGLITTRESVMGFFLNLNPEANTSTLGINDGHVYEVGQYYQIGSLGSLSQSDWNILAGTASTTTVHAAGASGISVTHRDKVLISNVNGPEKTYAVGDVYRAACSPNDPYGKGISAITHGSSGKTIYQTSGWPTDSASGKADPYHVSIGGNYDAVVVPVLPTSNLLKDVPVFTTAATEKRKITINSTGDGYSFNNVKSGTAYAFIQWAMRYVDVDGLDEISFAYMIPGVYSPQPYVRAKDEFSPGRIIYQIATPKFEGRDATSPPPKIIPMTWSAIIDSIDCSVTELIPGDAGDPNSGSYRIDFAIYYTHAEGTFKNSRRDMSAEVLPPANQNSQPKPNLGPGAIEVFEGMLFNKANGEGRKTSNPQKQSYNLLTSRNNFHTDGTFEHSGLNEHSPETRLVGWLNEMQATDATYLGGSGELFHISPENVDPTYAKGYGIETKTQHIESDPGSPHHKSKINGYTHARRTFPSMGFPSNDLLETNVVDRGLISGTLPTSSDYTVNYKDLHSGTYQAITPGLAGYDFRHTGPQRDASLRDFAPYAEPFNIRDIYGTYGNVNGDHLGLSHFPTNSGLGVINPFHGDKGYLFLQQVGEFYFNSLFSAGDPSGDLAQGVREDWIIGDTRDVPNISTLISTDPFNSLSNTPYGQHLPFGTRVLPSVYSAFDTSGLSTVGVVDTQELTASQQGEKKKENKVSNYMHAYKPFRYQYTLGKTENARLYPHSNRNNKTTATESQPNFSQAMDDYNDDTLREYAYINMGFLCKYDSHTAQAARDHDMHRIDVPYDTDDPSKFKITVSGFSAKIKAKQESGERGRVMYPGVAIIKSDIYGSSDRDDYTHVVAHTRSKDSEMGGEDRLYEENSDVPPLVYYIEEPGSYVVTYCGLGYGNTSGGSHDFRLSIDANANYHGPTVTVETAIV